MSYIRYRHFYGRTIAYTEDDIEVKRLFLYRVPLKIKLETVRDYFATFGKVLNVELVEKRRKKNFKFGSVLFESCHDAATVLAKDSHLIGTRLVKVEPYYSWGQPAVVCFEPVPQTSPVLRLSEDCLGGVYRYLNLTDQLNIARALKRCPPLYSCINLAIFQDASLWDIRDFFHLFGYHLREIVGQIPRNRHQRTLEFIGAHCRRLKRMRLTNSHLSVSNMYKLFAHLRQLEQLELSNCDLTDDCLPALSRLCKLTKLNLGYNDMLTGFFMDKLPNAIVSLDLRYCYDVSLRALPAICSALPHLKDLSVNAAQTEFTDVFRELVEGHCCDQLEAISLKTSTCLDSCSHLDYLARLPGLTKLTMYDSPPSLSLLQSLVEHKADQLTHLESNSNTPLGAEQLELISRLSALRILSVSHNNEIDDAVLDQLCRLQHLEQINLQCCKKVTEHAVLRLLLKCPKLHLLQLQRCSLLSPQLVHRIIRELRQLVVNRLNRRQMPVKLHFLDAKFDESSMKHPDIDAKDVVHVELNRCTDC